MSGGAGALLWQAVRASRSVGEWQPTGPMGQRPGRLADGWWPSCVGVGVAARLFFQCIMRWRSLPWSRGSVCQSFSSPWCFTSAKCVSSISARSLIAGAHTVCVCVPVAILDPPPGDLTKYSKCPVRSGVSCLHVEASNRVLCAKGLL
jgi:hypothetical protein